MTWRLAGETVEVLAEGFEGTGGGAGPSMDRAVGSRWNPLGAYVQYDFVAGGQVGTAYSASRKLMSDGQAAKSRLNDMPVVGSDLRRAAGELSACLGLLVRRLRQVHVDGELSLSQMQVLVRLERDGPATPGVLAAGEQITPQSMGAILAPLEERGPVARRGDPSDGRRVVMSVTESGRESLQGVRHEKTQRLARAMEEGLTPAEQRQLIAVIPLLQRLGPLV